ncbi:MAG: tetratricopeptide repeat protein [Spirochaetota bacterium]
MKIIFLFLFCLIGNSLTADSIRDAYNLEKKKSYAKALKIYERLCSEDAHNYFFHLKAGWLAYLSGRLSKSVNFYNKAIIIESGAIEPRIALLKPLIALGKYKQAQATAKSVLRLDSKNYIARSRIAYSLYLSGQFRGAEKYYISLVYDYPTDVEMLIGLGWTYLRRGKKRSAREVFQRARNIQPENTRILKGLVSAK